MWLQVRDDNPSAVKLYESQGFIEQARRTTWTIQPGKLEGESPVGGRIVHQKSRHWKQQRKWLRQNYPDQLFWYWPVKPVSFRPGIISRVMNFFAEFHLQHWGVEQQGELLGILTWRNTLSYADQLWLAAPPQTEDQVLQTLLPYLRNQRRSRRPLSIELPQGRAVKSLQAAGFRIRRTLVWMEVKF